MADRYGYQVNGSSAYVYAPEREIEYEQERREVQRVQPHHHSAHKAQTRYSVSVMSVLGLAAAVFMLILSVFAYIRLTEVSGEISELEERRTELDDENRRLKIAYEQAFDTSEIEEYAINVLGMQKPVEEQTVYLDASTKDKSIVINTVQESDGGWSEIFEFTKSLLVYFQK